MSIRDNDCTERCSNCKCNYQPEGAPYLWCTLWSSIVADSDTCDDWEAEDE